MLAVSHLATRFNIPKWVCWPWFDFTLWLRWFSACVHLCLETTKLWRWGFCIFLCYPKIKKHIGSQISSKLVYQWPYQKRPSVMGSLSCGPIPILLQRFPNSPSSQDLFHVSNRRGTSRAAPPPSGKRQSARWHWHTPALKPWPRKRRNCPCQFEEPPKK